MQYFYIYKTTNLINNKFYIGVHCTNKILNNYLGSGVHVRRAINKCGIENFKKEILAFFKDKYSLLNAERFIVNEDFINDPLCMNMKVGGIGGWTKSACRNGALTRIGTKHTFETKQQISKSLKGHICSEETKQKISDSKHKNPRRSYQVSEETRKKISEARKGMSFTEEHKKNLSIAKAGKTRKPCSPETKERIQESCRRTWVAKMNRKLNPGMLDLFLESMEGLL